MTGTYSRLRQLNEYSPIRQEERPSADGSQTEVPETRQEGDRTENRTQQRTEVRSEKRSEKRTDALPIKRRTKRYSFEFYDDQVMKLRQLKRLAEDRGEGLTLSDMVREALDLYLKNKTNG